MCKRLVGVPIEDEGKEEEVGSSEDSLRSR